MYSWSSPPVWSFNNATRGDELKQSTSYYAPGPGTYDESDQNTYKQHYPTWKVGTGDRPDLYSSWNKNIGPGSYEVAKKPVDKAKKKTFSKSKKDSSELKKGSNPVGPGSYFPKKFTETAPVFSFGYKTEGLTFATNEYPGPGTYEIKNIIDEAFERSMRPPGSRSAFTRTAPHAASRPIEVEGGKPSTPAPGHHYATTNENFHLRYFTPTWSFGKSHRDALYNDETKHVPGPGNYAIQSALQTRNGFTILGKHDQKRASSSTPGPNVYNPDIGVLRKTAPSFRIGKAERKNMAMGNVEYPGPGAYFKKRKHKRSGHDEDEEEEEEENHVEESGANRGFTLAKRRELDAADMKTFPGPGQYEAIETIGSNAKYSMGIKGGAKKVTEVLPGPGEYEPFASVYLEKNIGAIIGTSQRPPLYKKGGAPGPGQYDTRGNLGGSTYKIGSGKRPGMVKNSDEPGPGFYNIPSAIGNIPKYLRAGFAQANRKTIREKEALVNGV